MRWTVPIGSAVPDAVVTRPRLRRRAGSHHLRGASQPAPRCGIGPEQAPGHASPGCRRWRGSARGSRCDRPSAAHRRASGRAGKSASPRFIEPGWCAIQRSARLLPSSSRCRIGPHCVSSTGNSTSSAPATRMISTVLVAPAQRVVVAVGHALPVEPVAVAVGESPRDVTVAADHQRRQAGQGEAVRVDATALRRAHRDSAGAHGTRCSARAAPGACRRRRSRDRRR